GRRRVSAASLSRGLPRRDATGRPAGARGLCLMEPRRLRAAKGDGEVLAEPPLGEAARLIAANRDALGRWDHDFQGRRAGRLRAMARSEVLAASRAYLRRFGLDVPATPEPSAPWVVTGHQPELF